MQADKMITFDENESSSLKNNFKSQQNFENFVSYCLFEKIKMCAHCAWIFTNPLPLLVQLLIEVFLILAKLLAEPSLLGIAET